MFDVSKDELVAFLTELREGAVKTLNAQPDCDFHQEVYALIDRDLQGALRAQQREREESRRKPPKARVPRKRRSRRAAG
jgi:hypothetical protein